MNTTLAGKVAALFIALLPFVTTNKLFIGSVNGKYFFVLAVVAVFLLAWGVGLVRGTRTITLKGRWLLGASGLVLLVYVISALSGVYPAGSLFPDILRAQGVFFLSSLGLLSWWVSESLQKNDWKLVWYAIAFSGGLFALFSFFPRVFGGHAFTLGNTTFAGSYLVLVVIITLIAFVETPKGSWLRKVLGVLVCVQVLSPLLVSAGVWMGTVSFGELIAHPALLLGLARASGVTVIVVLVYLLGNLLLKRVHQERLIPFYGGACVLAVGVLLVLLFVPGSVVQERYIEESTAARVLVWQEGFAAFNERPLLGWGPENFRFAHEKYIDSRLYLEENIGEVWFDRAHNVIVDTLVSVGAVGVFVTLLAVGVFLFVVVRAARAGLLKRHVAVLLGVLVGAHVLQLQTSFDIVVTYVFLSVVLGYGLWLERRMYRERTSAISPLYQKAFGIVLLLLVLLGGKVLLLDEYRRQSALIDIFRTRNNEEQLVFIEKALDGSASYEALRLSSSSLISGLLDGHATATGPERTRLFEAGLSQLDAYETHYKAYLARTPHDYRMRMNYAYLLLIQTIFGEDRLADAQEIIDASYELSPDNPLTYVLDALTVFYGGNIEEARRLIASAPSVPLTAHVAAYIEKGAETFPTITVLRLENL